MFTTRAAEGVDHDFLWEMLYQALHVRPGDPPMPRTLLDAPDIAHYLIDFGSRDGDDARVAVDDSDLPIGAAWVRLMPADDPGYGFVAEHIPEISMAVVPEWRGRGVGTQLIRDLIARHPVISLSVDNDNVGAMRLYERLGFVSVGTVGTSITMLRGLL
ncbi:MAG: GNAT family N-acetyltransferase [Ilumatobacteraceae bacterium]